MLHIPRNDYANCFCSVCFIRSLNFFSRPQLATVPLTQPSIQTAHAASSNLMPYQKVGDIYLSVCCQQIFILTINLCMCLPWSLSGCWYIHKLCSYKSTDLWLLMCLRHTKALHGYQIWLWIFPNPCPDPCSWSMPLELWPVKCEILWTELKYAHGKLLTEERPGLVVLDI